MSARNKPNRDIDLSYFIFVIVQSLSSLCLTLCDSMDCARQAFLSFIVFRSLLRLMSIEMVMSFNHLILCRPLLLLPSIFPCIRVFSNESALSISWPNYWSFSISLSNEYSGLISFRIDWFNLLAVQGTLKSLLLFYNYFFFNIAGVSFFVFAHGSFFSEVNFKV